jgi:hypothetical protein
MDETSISVDRIMEEVNVFAPDGSGRPPALGTASRDAQALHQSLFETLLSLGLVKNALEVSDARRTSRSSTSASIFASRARRASASKSSIDASEGRFPRSLCPSSKISSAPPARARTRSRARIDRSPCR